MPSWSESRAVGAALGWELTVGVELGADDTVGTAEGIELTEGCALGIKLTVGAELRDGGELVVGAVVGWASTGVTTGTGRPRRATTRNTPAIIVRLCSGAVTQLRP